MSGLAVRPVRFTDNLDEMRRFLEVLGLHPRTEAEGGGWVDMVAGSGMLALHSAKNSDRQAPSGLTALSFEEVGDVEALAKRLTSAGVPDVTVYDEAYGRVLTFRDPLGDDITVDETSEDLYGFRRHEAGDVRTPLTVMPVRFTDPLGPYGQLLEALGMERRDEPNPHFVAYRSGSRGGLVGLHAPLAESRWDDNEAGAVNLSFETAEDLVAVSQRLTDAGFAGDISKESFGNVLRAVDADGQSVEVHQAPPIHGDR